LGKLLQVREYLQLRMQIPLDVPMKKNKVRNPFLDKTIEIGERLEWVPFDHEEQGINYRSDASHL
jgi:hypothetical protein